ncbi:hypothetical protein C0J52_21090 [Blattella germanica]|nr:hypothetical protein C0J52_21090 [Blattella germanica]
MIFVFQVMNFHGLIAGRTEWILRTDGSVVSTKSRSPFYKRVPKPEEARVATTFLNPGGC